MLVLLPPPLGIGDDVAALAGELGGRSVDPVVSTPAAREATAKAMTTGPLLLQHALAVIILPLCLPC